MVNVHVKVNDDTLTSCERGKGAEEELGKRPGDLRFPK